MKEKSVKKRIFLSNAGVILVSLAFIGLVNIGILKLYWETMEREWRSSMIKMTGSHEIEELLKKWTVHQESFYILLLLDAVICVLILIVVSMFFTRGLAHHIMKPLDILGEGARRIRNNELEEQLEYHGDIEFEMICALFNEMQQHLLEEQEKNQNYESARTEMIAGISHDLRTPLTAVRGTIKALMDGVVTDENIKNKFLQTAYRRTTQMNGLLDQLFDISRLETGNQPFHLQSLQLNTFLKSYAEGKKETIDDTQMRIKYEERACEGCAKVDPEQLQRVLDNLLENSRKYAGVVPVEITISIQKTEHTFCIRVADNGKGVDEEKLEAVFHEFYRGDASRGEQKGYGLGLYIVNCLITAMGGNVHAENEDGFAVYIELPKEAE